MEHEYLIRLNERKIELEEEIKSYVEGDFQNYLENKDDDSYSFDDREADYINSTSLEEMDIDNCIDFLNRFDTDCLVDFDEYDKLVEEIKDAEYKLMKIEKIVNNFKNSINDLSVSTSKKSVSTYLTFEATKENFGFLMKNVDDADYYEEMFDNEEKEITNDEDVKEMLKDIKELEVRISDHEVGTYWGYFGDTSYNSDNAKINL